MIMTVGDMLQDGKENGFYSVILLINFLVNEKKVVTLSDDVKALDLYLLPKHRDKMNEHLRHYINKLNGRF